MMDLKTLLEACRFSSEKMRKVGLFETPRLFCDLYCLEPNQTQKIHTHEGSDKVYVALEGRGNIQVGQENQEIGPGQAVIAPAGEPHGVRNPNAERLVLLVFMAPPPSHA